MSFDFIVRDDVREDAGDIEAKPKDGCYVHGLYLEGAKWNHTTHTLDDPVPKELYSKMPVIHLLPRANMPEPTSGIYRCPCYKILTRRGQLSTTGHSTNFVCWITLPSGGEASILRRSLVSETNMQTMFADSEKWGKAGVALFCALRY